MGRKTDLRATSTRTATLDKKTNKQTPKKNTLCKNNQNTQYNHQNTNNREDKDKKNNNKHTASW
jgi:hypothetical protein